MIAWLLLACGDRGTPTYVGTVEVTEVAVASLLPGRLTQVAVEEGDRVQAGDLVFALDAAPAQAELALRAAAVQMAEAAVGAADAQAQVARAQVAWLDRESDRAGRMQQAGVGSAQQASAAGGQLAVAWAQLQAATQGQAQAQAALIQAQAAHGLAQDRLDDTRVLAPTDGVVLTRARQPGEVVAPGVTVLTLGDLQHPRLRIYVPAPVVGRLRPGDPVRVRTDVSDAVHPARIARIAARAEFTPREILTPDERVKQVFAVDLALEPAPGLLPGLPAEAELDP